MIGGKKKELFFFFNFPLFVEQLMMESPDVRSTGTLKQLIRILNSLHDECISRDLRSDAAVFFHLILVFKLMGTS